MTRVLVIISIIIVGLLAYMTIGFFILYNLFWIFFVAIWRSFKEDNDEEQLSFKEAKKQIKEKIMNNESS